MRIDRMLSITLTLLNRDKVSARELAEKFEVSVRTIYRDIESINMAGIPVVAYSGNNGGFGIMENYKLDRQLLSMDDLLGIMTALNGVGAALDNVGMDSTIEKIRNLIPKDKEEELNLRFEQIVIDILPWAYPARQKNMIRDIQRSIENNTLLNISYKNLKSVQTSRIIEPMTLILRGYAWYLFGYCRLKNDYRMFRITRISDLFPIGERFVRRKESYKDHMEWDNPDEKVAHLLLKFSPDIRAAVENYFDENFITIDKDGFVIARVSFPEDSWLYSFILSYGENVEVLEPKYMRELIRDKARKMLGNYEGKNSV